MEPGLCFDGDAAESGEMTESDQDCDMKDATSDEPVVLESDESAEAAMRGLRALALSWQEMGLAEIWRDLVMNFLVDELASIVKERCQWWYDANYAKGLLRRLTTYLYSPVLRWLRTAYGLPLWLAAKWRRTSWRRRRRGGLAPAGQYYNC
jgi:hypothetical protein